MDSVVPTNHEVKLKESEKSNEFQDSVRELKKTVDMKMKFLPIVLFVQSPKD